MHYQSDENYSAYHLYIVRLQADRAAIDRATLFEKLKTSGIGVNVHYIPVHLQPYYQKMGFRDGDFPQAEEYYSEAVSLPIFPAMSNKQQQHVIDALRKILH